MITVLVDWQNVCEVREEKNEPASPAVPTLRDVEEQYQSQHCQFSTQEELENIVALQVQSWLSALSSDQIIVIILLRWNSYQTPVKSWEL